MDEGRAQKFWNETPDAAIAAGRMAAVTPLKIERDRKVIEARFGALLESTPDAVVIVNAIGRIRAMAVAGAVRPAQ